MKFVKGKRLFAGLFATALLLSLFLPSCTENGDPVEPGPGAPSNGDDSAPREVSGEDPDMVELYPDSVRIAFITDNGSGHVQYVAPAEPEDVIAFFEEKVGAMDGFHHSSTPIREIFTAEYEDGKAMQVEVSYIKSRDYPGYAEYSIIWGEAGQL